MGYGVTFVSLSACSTYYRVKQSECYKVSQDQALTYQPTYTDDPVDDESPYVCESEPLRVTLPVIPGTPSIPPDPPDIPLEISQPDDITTPEPPVSNESVHTNTETMIADQRPKRSRQVPHHLKDYLLS